MKSKQEQGVEFGQVGRAIRHKVSREMLERCLGRE
jgi:hypothetical protein